MSGHLIFEWGVFEVNVKQKRQQKLLVLEGGFVTGDCVARTVKRKSPHGSQT